MRTSLGRKLLVYTAGIIVMLLLAIFFVLERTQSQAWEDHLFNQSLSFARLATPELLKQFRGAFPPDEPAEIARMHEFLALNRELMQFSLVSTTGRRLYVSAVFPAYVDMDLSQVANDDLGERLAARRTTAVTRELANGRRFLDLVEPAFGPSGERVLSVRYLISYDSVDARVAELRRHFMVIAVMAVLLCILMVGLVARRFIRPIRELTAGAHAIARGELETRITPQSHDELGVLARTFNAMAESLAGSRTELTGKNEELSRANDELRAMQEQLLRSERLAAIGQLAAGVSHEIDNPVGIILGHAELLYDDLAEDDERREDVKAIIDECRRCKRITGGLLGFARPVESQSADIDMLQLIRDILPSLQPQKLFKGITLRLDTAVSTAVITADGDQLRQVLINLLINAAQALAGKGLVVIHLAADHETVSLDIDDDGPGIPEPDWERVFQPFFSTKAHGEGTGLGLAVCRKLVEAQGGTVAVGRSPLGGASLQIRLPASRRKML